MTKNLPVQLSAELASISEIPNGYWSLWISSSNQSAPPTGIHQSLHLCAQIFVPVQSKLIPAWCWTCCTSARWVFLVSACIWKQVWANEESVDYRQGWRVQSSPVLQALVQVWFSILPVDTPFKPGSHLPWWTGRTENVAWIRSEDWIGPGRHACVCSGVQF